MVMPDLGIEWARGEGVGGGDDWPGQPSLVDVGAEIQIPVVPFPNTCPMQFSLPPPPGLGFNEFSLKQAVAGSWRSSFEALCCEELRLTVPLGILGDISK